MTGAPAVKGVILGLLLVAQQVTPQCGSSGSTASAALQNMVPLIIDAGPARNAANVAFLTVTVCVPGQSANCQAISGVEVDTGSTGLRILSSALTLSLPQQTTGGATVTECFPFQDGYTWGPVATADVQIGSKQASGVPIQIIGAPGEPAPPASCTSSGGTSEQTLDALGANGVLGIGVFLQDCGPGCVFSGSSNAGLYYACSSGNCQVTPQSLAQQLQNPVSMFSSDNNGTTIMLPAASTSQTSGTGVLIFGIGTQSNNALGNATVFTLDASGNFVTKYGQTSSTGFIDSGSNGYYFLDSATTGLPICPDTKDFYCPQTTTSVTATNTGANSRSGSVSFNIANGDTQLNLPDSVLPQIGGPFAGYFDWGLPFFYGRTVFTAIESRTTSGGTGPYFAY
ncbi:MAG TPA: DUF3443 family protein [Vicinamibacterales bacterium]|jgi:hypothetical protein|nr:DUF3443 family protein [Vicinamibacterales bacterium]